MDTADPRYAFRLLVLLVCAIAAWRGGDQTPSREVVELVSVVYKPARMETKAAGESANAQTAAPAVQTNADRAASPKRLLQERTPLLVRNAKAVPRQPRGVKLSCRQPVCRASAPTTKAATRRIGARQARKAEPPLPAVLVPVRKLGLYLQARLGVARDGKAAPGKRKR